MKIERETLEDEEGEKNPKLYKFKTALANIFKFYEWANEKQLKKAISDYIFKHRLYNRTKEEVDIYK